jgi:nitrogen PTS system EIIA component
VEYQALSLAEPKGGLPARPPPLRPNFPAPGARRARRLGGTMMEGWMKLSDFVVREAIVVDLQAVGKEEAIREIVRSLHSAGKLAESEIDSVSRAILSREELGSTGIGQGVAVPHTRHPTVDRLIGTVALSHRGVDFAALDGEPVDILFLLVSPPNQPGDHLRALENISRHLKDERFVSFLRQAKTRENVVELLDEADQAAS